MRADACVCEFLGTRPLLVHGGGFSLLLRCCPLRVVGRVAESMGVSAVRRRLACPQASSSLSVLGMFLCGPSLLLVAVRSSAWSLVGIGRLWWCGVVWRGLPPVHGTRCDWPCSTRLMMWSIASWVSLQGRRWGGPRGMSVVGGGHWPAPPSLPLAVALLLGGGVPGHFTSCFVVARGAVPAEQRVPRRCRWAGFRESCVRRRVKRPFGIELLFGRDLHLCWQLEPAEAVEVARGPVYSRLQSPSIHTTMKLSPLRMSMSDMGGVPGFLLVPSVTVRSQAVGAREKVSPHLCLGAAAAGPRGVAWMEVCSGKKDIVPHGVCGLVEDLWVDPSHSCLHKS